MTKHDEIWQYTYGKSVCFQNYNVITGITFSDSHDKPDEKKRQNQKILLHLSIAKMLSSGSKYRVPSKEWL